MRSAGVFSTQDPGGSGVASPRWSKAKIDHCSSSSLATSRCPMGPVARKAFHACPLASPVLAQPDFPPNRDY